MTGVAADTPGSGLFHSSVLVSSEAGKFVSLLLPLKFGPRHWGQSDPNAIDIEETIISKIVRTGYLLDK